MNQPFDPNSPYHSPFSYDMSADGSPPGVQFTPPPQQPSDQSAGRLRAILATILSTLLIVSLGLGIYTSFVNDDRTDLEGQISQMQQTIDEIEAAKQEGERRFQEAGFTSLYSDITAINNQVDSHWDVYMATEIGSTAETEAWNKFLSSIETCHEATMKYNTAATNHPYDPQLFINNGLPRTINITEDQFDCGEDHTMVVLSKLY